MVRLDEGVSVNGVRPPSPDHCCLVLGLTAHETSNSCLVPVRMDGQTLFIFVTCISLSYSSCTLRA